MPTGGTRLARIFNGRHPETQISHDAADNAIRSALPCDIQIWAASAALPRMAVEEKTLGGLWPRVRFFVFDLDGVDKETSHAAIARSFAPVCAQLDIVKEAKSYGVSGGKTIHNFAIAFANEVEKTQLNPTIENADITVHSLSGGIFNLASEVVENNFDADINCRILADGIGTSDGNIRTLDRSIANQKRSGKWLDDAFSKLGSHTEVILGSGEISIEERIKKMTLDMRTSMPHLNFISLGAYFDGHQLFDMAAGKIKNIEIINKNVKKLSSKLNELSDIVEKIYRATDGSTTGRFICCGDVANRFFTIDPPREFRHDAALLILIQRAANIVNVDLNTEKIYTSSKTLLRFAKSNCLICTGSEKHYATKALLDRNILDISNVCLDLSLAKQLIVDKQYDLLSF